MPDINSLAIPESYEGMFNYGKKATPDISNDRNFIVNFEFSTVNGVEINPEMPADVVLVFDISDGMDPLNDPAQESLWTQLKETANDIIDVINPSVKGTHVGVVVYGGGGSTAMNPWRDHKLILDFTEDADTIKNSYRTRTQNEMRVLPEIIRQSSNPQWTGGDLGVWDLQVQYSNYSAGFKGASDLFASSGAARQNVKKYVIFITGVDMSCYYDAGSSTLTNLSPTGEQKTLEMAMDLKNQYTSGDMYDIGIYTIALSQGAAPSTAILNLLNPSGTNQYQEACLVNPMVSDIELTFEHIGAMTSTPLPFSDIKITDPFGLHNGSPIVSLFDRNQDGVINAKDVDMVMDNIINVTYSNNDMTATYTYQSGVTEKELVIEVKPNTTVTGQYTIALEHSLPLDDGKIYTLNYVVELRPDFEDGVDYFSNEEAIITYDYDTDNDVEIRVDSPIITNTPLNYAIPGNKVIPNRVIGFTDFAGFFEFGLFRDLTSPQSDVIVSNNAGGNFSFPVKLYRGRSYVFYVKELPQLDPDNGWAIDPNPIKVEVFVRQLSRNVLVRDKTEFSRWNATTGQYEIDPGLTKAIFNNEYQHQRDAAIIFKGVKKVSGQDMPTEPFTFGVFEGTSTTPLQTAQNDPLTGNFEFLPLEITEAKNQTYVIKETSLSQYGWLSDTQIFTYNVQVKDNYKGTLIAEVVGRSDITPANAITITGIEFTNIYKTKPAKATIEAVKVCTNWVNSLPSFEFQLAPLSGPTPPSTVQSKNGTIKFEVTYDQVGVYRYELSEVPVTLRGWEVDANVYQVVVDIKVNEKGELYPAEIAYYDPMGTKLNDVPQFENKYDISTVSITIPGKKTINKSQFPKDYFFFEVVDSAGLVCDVATIDENGDFTLTIKDIHRVGIFNYIVRESTPSGNGWAMDPRVYPILVTVINNGGNLDVTWVSQLGAVVFENTYSTGSHTPEIHGYKTWSGWDEVAAGRVEKFEFLLMDVNGNQVATATNNDEGLIEFKLEFKHFTDAGDHEFEIQENKESVTTKPGWRIAEDKSYKVDVTIIDENGELSSKVSYPNGQPRFENIYQPQVKERISFNGIVRAEGAGLKNNFFHIGIFNEKGEQLYSTANDAIGDYLFPELDFSQPGEYIYTIRQTNSQTDPFADEWSGWVYDTTQYEITIKVTDDFKGTLECAITNINVMEEVGGVLVPKAVTDKNRFDFLNKYYVVPLVSSIEGQKIINGWSEGLAPTFDFHLIDIDQGDSGLTYRDHEYDPVTGTIAFSMTYKAPGVYHYVMKEVQKTYLGWTLDQREWAINAYVTDNGEGHLQCRYEYPEGIPTFVNTYEKPEIKLEDFDFTLSATVFLENWYGCKEFPVILADASTGNIINESCTINGHVDFSNLTFSEPGTYTYNIYQPYEEYCQWQIDEEVYRIKVNVFEITLPDSTGWLSLSVEYLDGKPYFLNKYTGKEECIKVILDIKSKIKLIDRNTLTSGNFLFAVTGECGQISASANLRKKKIHDYFVEGKFSEICFTKPGTYHYTVWQTAAYPKNWHYCHQKYPLTITVSARPSGKLVAKIDYPHDSPNFENWFVID